MTYESDTIRTLTRALEDSPHTFGQIALPDRIRPDHRDDPNAPRRLGPVTRVRDAFVVFHPERGSLVLSECHLAADDDEVAVYRALDRAVSDAVGVETRLRAGLERWQLWQSRTVPMGWAVVVHGLERRAIAELDFPQWFCLSSANIETLPDELDAILERFGRLWRDDVSHLMGDLMMSVCSEGALDGSFIPITAFHESIYQLERAA